MVNNPPVIQETQVQPLGGEDPLVNGNGYPLTLQNLRKSDLEVLFKVTQLKNSGQCGPLSPFCPLTLRST